MRSLTSKLILAFLVTSLVSISIIVALTRFSTNREFNRFITGQRGDELVDGLEAYYEEHGTWDGLNAAPMGFHANQTFPREDLPSFFSVTDAHGIVVVESYQFRLGDVLDPRRLETGRQIQVNNETVGYLIIEIPPERRDPREDEFIRRLDLSLFLTAIGTVLFALLLGVILSRSITQPVRELIAATRAMAAGKMVQNVPVRSMDEIGELAKSFNKMSGDLARSFNLRKQMTADIAHELRTPLSLIIGHAEAVHDGVLPPTRENFEIIREEADRLEQLVNDLRTLSLADAGELPLEFQNTDLNKLLGDIQARYLFQFQQKRITFELKSAEGALLIHLDPARITQVFTNILENALNFTPGGGRVEIELNPAAEDIQISIQDDGPGVTAEEASRLFDRFYRADPSRAREDGGSGLGLAISKSIIEMHHGRIWAESEKGSGLRMVIQLPRAGNG
jgi:signal transduction histidine kinase